MGISPSILWSSGRLFCFCVGGLFSLAEVNALLLLLLPPDELVVSLSFLVLAKAVAAALLSCKLTLFLKFSNSTSCIRMSLRCRILSSLYARWVAVSDDVSLFPVVANRDKNSLWIRPVTCCCVREYGLEGGGG